MTDARPIEPNAIHPALHRALQRAQRVLWQSQQADGHWDAEGDVGPAPTAQAVIALSHMGKLTRADGAECGRQAELERLCCINDIAFECH